MSQFLELCFNPVPTSRRSAKKSKRGCKVCKLRKVKCDETRPVCSNCKTYFSNQIEKCEYGPFSGSQNARIRSLLPTSSSAISSAPLPSQLPIFYTYAKLPQTVGMTTLDPFNTQLKSKLPSADQLLHHYLSTIVGKCLPRGYKPEANPLALGFWPLVQTDTLLLHAILQVSAFDLEWQKGEPNSHHSEKYAKECIRLLRDRVQDPVYSASNQTIGAVATLASLEYGRRNMIAMRTHMEGLKKMVAVRGGFEKLRLSNPAAAAIAFWFSLLLTFEPQFPPGEPVELQEPPQWLEEISASSRVSKLLNFKTHGVRKDISNILLEIRYMSRYFPAQSDVKSSPTQPDIHIHAKVCSILGRLLQAKPDQDPESYDARITKCCCLAASIFLFLPFENHFPDPTLLLNSLVHRLQTALSSIVPSSLDGNKLLAWLLSVGGVAASNLPTERDWFVSHLVESAVDLELKSWDDMKSCLKKVLWIDAMDDSPFRELWEEVLSSVTRLTTQDPFCAIRY